MSVLFFQCGTNPLERQIHWHVYFGIAQTSHLALLLEELPRNIGVPSLVNLLPRCHSKGNLSLGIFGHLEKVALIIFWSVL